MSATGRMAAPTRAMSSRPAPQLHQPPRLNRVVETPLLLLPPGSVPAEHLRNSLHHRRRRAPSWITSTPISAAAAVDPQTGEQNPQQSSQGEGQSLSGAVDVGSAPCWTDELDEVQRQVLADEWGFSSIGTSFPAGVNPQVLMRAIPEELLEVDRGRAVMGLVAPALLMASGLCCAVLAAGSAAWWQRIACWVITGTGYAGLFSLAHEAARDTLLPEHPVTQDLLGTLIMAPSLFAFEPWKLRAFAHFNQVNQLEGDVQGSWHPLTLEQLAQAGPLARSLLRLVATTPLKLLSSIGEWVRSMQDWDLRTFYQEARGPVLWSWCVPAAFAGLVLPSILLNAGLQGLVDLWLGPWLVFHAWLSILSLCRHTAPHIPWRRPGMEAGSYDRTRSVVSGTVTLQLPGWLERLLGFQNHALPQMLAWGVIPYYHAAAATQALRSRLWPYMSEAPLTIKLLTNHITKWQVYDEDSERYITFDEAEARLAPAQPLAA